MLVELISWFCQSDGWLLNLWSCCYLCCAVARSEAGETRLGRTLWEELGARVNTKEAVFQGNAFKVWGAIRGLKCLGSLCRVQLLFVIFTPLWASKVGGKQKGNSDLWQPPAAIATHSCSPAGCLTFQLHCWNMGEGCQSSITQDAWSWLPYVWNPQMELPTKEMWHGQSHQKVFPPIICIKWRLVSNK